MRPATSNTLRLAAILLALGANFVAVAQEDATVPTPPIDKNQLPSPAKGYGVIFVMALAILGVSLMPSKRSHLD